MEKFIQPIKETINRLKNNNPEYFQRWFWIMVFTAILGFSSELTSAGDMLPEFFKMLIPYLKAIGLTGMFFTRLPNKEKKDAN